MKKLEKLDLSRFRGRFKPATYKIAKGLSPLAAWKKACRIATKDFRGMKYDPKTGRLVLT